jgi:hypothetical protein
MKRKHSSYLLLARLSLLLILFAVSWLLPLTDARDYSDRNSIVNNNEGYGRKTEATVSMLSPQDTFIRSLAGTSTNETSHATEEVSNGHASNEGYAATTELEEVEEDEEHIHKARYCLFPSFFLTVGVIVFYCLSR